jgi:ABC-type spermidine/putrescine transport system permease subunit II
MRTLAGFMNLINLNDEGRISNALGLTPAFLPAVVTGILFYLVYTTIKAQHYKIRLVTSTVLLIMLFSSILILSDQAFNLVLIN